ncbi:DUF2663 family protein [Bacillus weihaiensis]|uniref:DUF2663 domain-containing protein n=1 Tax=Bacillus weihaiensis TaxID=1547283 RepID=A0A1L3MQE6_9BACI|nr:DUF2663 family protein [Bacillus weihaiensis]APH04569.1 hypothetical protein A9C19_07320 [Bacillus weihaiensis]
MRKIEPFIQQLNYHTDLPTKKMLNNLVDRKRKFDGYKDKCFKAQLFTFTILIGFLVYLYVYIIQPSGGRIEFVISSIFDGELHLFIVLLIVAGYATAKYYKKKEDKAEKEFHALRCEVISKSSELWPQPTRWEKRHDVFAMMKNEYDINLFHESK